MDFVGLGMGTIAGLGLDPSKLFCFRIGFFFGFEEASPVEEDTTLDLLLRTGFFFLVGLAEVASSFGLEVSTFGFSIAVVLPFCCCSKVSWHILASSRREDGSDQLDKGCYELDTGWR